MVLIFCQCAKYEFEIMKNLFYSIKLNFSSKIIELCIIDHTVHFIRIVTDWDLRDSNSIIV